MEEKKIIETNYLRLDLTEVKESRATYYRLTKGQVEFLNLIEKDGSEIVGIQLDRDENNSIGFNIGFIVCGGFKPTKVSMIIKQEPIDIQATT